MNWAVGQKLQGSNYRIEKVLGEGSVGITYLARNENNRRVVIKTLSDRAQQRPDFDQLQAEFLNDALRLARCTHPHIARVEELIEEGGLCCMVMEYIEGEDLARSLENQGILPEDEALRYIEQIGAGLIAVHDLGLLHGNVKPQNIILRSGKSVSVLINFTIAREVESDCFAPIEQYEVKTKLGIYTDVYGLAATLYAILTGELPVTAAARAENVPLVAPKQLNPDISDRTNQAILQGMAFQPHERPQSITEWLQLLYNNPVTYLEYSTPAPRQHSPRKTALSPEFPWGLLAGVLLSCGWIGFALAQIMAPNWVWSLVLAGALIPQIAGYAIAIFASLAAAVLALNLIIEPSTQTLSNLPILATAISLSEMAVWYSALAIIFCAFSNSVIKQLNTLFSKFQALLILAVTSWLGLGLGRLLGFMFQ